MAKRNSKLAAIGGTAVALLLAAFGGVNLLGEDAEDTPSGITHGTSGGDEVCAVASLPKEAKQQIDDILDGAPSDDGPHDGKHFGNYEGLLPKQPSSYYREYTVKTPGLNHRGERRIVVGGGTKTNPENWYYSSDHYESFCTIPDAEG